MATTPKNYAHNLQLSTSAVIIVPVVPTNTNSVVIKLSFYNSGSSNRTVTVHVVESGGTADTGNTEAVKALAPGETWNVISVRNEVLSTGMTVQAKQNAGTDVNANCSGGDVI